MSWQASPENTKKPKGVIIKLFWLNVVIGGCKLPINPVQFHPPGQGLFARHLQQRPAHAQQIVLPLLTMKALPAALAEIDKPGLALIIQQNIRSEAHTSELKSLMRISYAVFCLIQRTPD